MSVLYSGTIADPEWNHWTATFPDIPEPTVFALKWVKARTRQARNTMPDTQRLAPSDRREIQKCLQDYAWQFSRLHRRPGEGFDSNGFVGVLSTIAGIAVLGVAPAIALGLGLVSILTFVRKDYNRRALDERERLTDMILEDIHAIELKLP